MTEIWINGTRIVTDEKTVIAYTLQNNDFLRSISDVQVSFTNVFKIPKQPNIDFFEQLGIAGNQSTKPYTLLTVKIVDDGIELFSDGIGIIRDSKGDFIEMNVVFESGLFKAIEGREITDMDFTSENHDLTISNVVNSLNVPATSLGYTYPTNLIFTKGKTLIDILDMLPCFNMFKLNEKIIDEAGFTYTWDDVDETEIKGTFITPETGVEQDLIETEITSTSNTNYTNSVTSQALSDSKINHLIATENIPTENRTYIVEVEVTRLRATIEESGNLLLAHKNVRLSASGGFLESDIIATSSLDEEFDQSVLKKGGVYRFIFYVGAVGGTPSWSLRFEFEALTASSSTATIDYDYDVDLSYKFIEVDAEGLSIDFASILSKTPQIDILKEILIRYACSIKKDKVTNHVTIKRLENILNDKSNSLDWSDKVIEKISESYQPKNFAKNNLFGYADDADDGVLTINNENLSAETEIYTSPFGSDLVTEGNLDVYEEDVNESGEIQSKKVSDITPKIGTMAINGTGNLYAFGILRQSGVTFKDFSSIDTQDNIDTHYTTVKASLDRLKSIDYRMRISKEDIYNFDPFKLIFLKQEGGHFYVSKIKNIVNGIGVATLIKVP